MQPKNSDSLVSWKLVRLYVSECVDVTKRGSWRTIGSFYFVFYNILSHEASTVIQNADSDMIYVLRSTRKVVPCFSTSTQMAAGTESVYFVH
jgi:hypothetical protein